jgi:hypothetical protein
MTPLDLMIFALFAAVVIWLVLDRNDPDGRA